MVRIALFVVCVVSQMPFDAVAQSLRQITSHARVHEVDPTVSADGTTVAWVEFSQTSPGYAIGIADGRGHKRRQFLSGPATIGGLRLSGDGTTLVYAYGTQLWVLPTAGGPPRAITPANKRCSSPSVTEDGQLVAYLARDFSSLTVEVVDTVTLAVTVIGLVPYGLISGPAIAGDGSSLVLTNKTPAGTDLWHYTLTGTPLRKLAGGVRGFEETFDHRGTITACNTADTTGWHLQTITTQGVATTIGSPGIEARPAIVSGNGDRVLWTDPDLRVAYVDGTAERRVVSLGASTSAPSVPIAASRDGSVVVFSTSLPLLRTNPYRDTELFVWRDALSGPEIARVGGTARFLIDVPTAPSSPYVARCSFSRVGGPIIPGVGRLPLAPDTLFRASGVLPSVFRNMQGQLDGKGRATFSIALPNLPALRGVRFYTAAVVAAPSPTITPAIARTIR